MGRKKRLPNPYSKGRRGATGASNELRVCSDLLDKGYDVFRAVSPDASCDIIVLKTEKLSRVEVRTGQRLKNGTISCGRHGSYDLLAVVIGESIFYEEGTVNRKKKIGRKLQVRLEVSGVITKLQTNAERQCP